MQLLDRADVIIWNSGPRRWARIEARLTTTSAAINPKYHLLRHVRLRPGTAATATSRPTTRSSRAGGRRALQSARCRRAALRAHGAWRTRPWAHRGADGSAPRCFTGERTRRGPGDRDPDVREWRASCSPSICTRRPSYRRAAPTGDPRLIDPHREADPDEGRLDLHLRQHPDAGVRFFDAIGRPELKEDPHASATSPRGSPMSPPISASVPR